MYKHLNDSQLLERPKTAKRTSSKTSVQMTTVYSAPLTRSYEKKPLPTQYKNQPHLLVTCDWLTVRLSDSLKPLFFEGGHCRIEGTVYRLELLPQGTRFFHKMARVFYGEIPFAEVQFDARMEVLKDTMFVKYDNCIFYDYSLGFTNIRDLCENFWSAIGAQFHGVTRCDIAIDGVDFGDFINRLAFTDTLVQLKVKNVTPTDFCMDTRVFRGFTVGSRGAKKYAVCYDKTREISDKGFKKQYILDYFSANGLDTSCGVQRFELRLDSEAFADMKDFKFSSDDFFTHESLVEIFEFQIRNFFEFVPGDAYSSDSRRSRREKLQFFDFSAYERKYVRVDRRSLEGTRTAKIIVGRLVRDAYLSPDEAEAFACLTTARDTVIKYHLFEWITRRSPFLMGDIEKYALVRGAPLCPALTRNLLYDLEHNSLHFN